VDPVLATTGVAGLPQRFPDYSRGITAPAIVDVPTKDD
jgi:hypothetical protein